MDNYQTPANAVTLLLPYLKPHSRILCPFDKISSQFVEVLTLAGHQVWFSHIEEPHIRNSSYGYGCPKDCLLHDNFFDYSVSDLKGMKIDYIISNPPFSIKDDILEKLYQLETPFAMLLPTYVLGGVHRYQLFKQHGVQLLTPNRRINYLDENSQQTKGNAFHSSFFCWNLLPEPLLFCEL